MYKLKCSCTNKKGSKVTGHPLEQLNTQRNVTTILTGYTPKLSPWKTGIMIVNRWNGGNCWRLRESLEIDMVVVRYGQDKLLNRDNGNFVKTNAWKPLFQKMKTLHWNLVSFCIKWQFCIVLWSVWKRLQPVRPKYHVLNNKTCVVLSANFDV